MTVISDAKKPKNQITGLLLTAEDEIVDSNSNEIVDNGSSTTQVIDDNEILVAKVDDDLNFNTEIMRRYIDVVNKPRWIVPLLPKDDSEFMLLTAIRHSYHKKDTDNDQFRDLYKNGFLVSFEKIMTDDAVLGWKMDILEGIYRNSIIMMQLCGMKIADDNLCILEILAIVFDPDVKYHQCCLNNYIQPSTVRVAQLDELFKINGKFGEKQDPDEDDSNNEEQEHHLLPKIADCKYALSSDNRRNKIIYVDLINTFGHFKGFDNLKQRFEQFKKLGSPDLSINLSLMLALLKPVALSLEYFTSFTIDKFILPIAIIIYFLMMMLGAAAAAPLHSLDSPSIKENVRILKSPTMDNVTDSLTCNTCLEWKNIDVGYIALVLVIIVIIYLFIEKILKKIYKKCFTLNPIPATNISLL